MESPENNVEVNEHHNTTECLNMKSNNASQQDQNCDVNTVPMKMYQLNIPSQNCMSQIKTECKQIQEDETENSKSDSHTTNDAKHVNLTWSVLKHKQLSDAYKNCDKSNSCVIKHLSDTISKDVHIDNSAKVFETSSPSKPKRNIKDRSFPLSLMKPITKIAEKKPDVTSQQCLNLKNDLSRQCAVEKTSREKFQSSTVIKDSNRSKRFTNDLPSMKNPLSEIAKIKTEESIQEWLARIGDSNQGSWSEESNIRCNKECKSQDSDAWHPRHRETDVKNPDNALLKQRSYDCKNVSDHNPLGTSYHRTRCDLSEQDSDCKNSMANEGLDANGLLCNASKASPANIPMVVMQCSRLHSRIGCKPPFQQTSLPMGTLVTGLYQESDWLYIQTPHGVEGFVTASNCAPIGTICDPSPATRRPWEPCDFPIQISIRKGCEFGRQHGSYISTKLPTNNGKQAVPYVSTVKMKTNFYSDRYFSHTFKSKDSIKMAKTVTDILRSSPETKVSN